MGGVLGLHLLVFSFRLVSRLIDCCLPPRISRDKLLSLRTAGTLLLLVLPPHLAHQDQQLWHPEYVYLILVLRFFVSHAVELY